MNDEKSAPPAWLFWLQLAYIFGLVGLSIAYANVPDLRRLVHDPAGPIPLSVAWWGALGAVTISMTGIFRNREKWNSSYNPWHISRPAIGAIAGSIGYLIFISVIRSTGASAPKSAPSAVVFDLVAFLVGYREAVFRELLQRATDVLLKPGTESKSNIAGDVAIFSGYTVHGSHKNKSDQSRRSLVLNFQRTSTPAIAGRYCKCGSPMDIGSAHTDGTHSVAETLPSVVFAR